MLIKDVEKITGLTKKSIRYYESKGLLTVSRGKENDYREYSEEEVNVLKKIKIYRFLDFSIEEIRSLLQMEQDAVGDELQKKADLFEKQKTEDDIKQDLCLQLKKKGNYEEFYDTVEFWESETMENFKNSVFGLSYTNVYGMIARTLMFSGPIVWLFFNIHDRKYEVLYWNAAISLICAVFLWCDWSAYFKFRRKHKEQLVKENKRNSLLIPTVILAFVCALAGTIGINILQEKLYVPTDFLFYENPHAAIIAMITAVIFGVIVGVAYICRSFRIRKMGDYDNVVEWISKHKKVRGAVVVVFLIVIYCGITSINVVTEDTITIYRPWNPVGTTYHYEDVTAVEARFTAKGEFRYKVTFDDTSIVFSTPSTNDKIERYNQDTYLELEEFDQKLMAFGVAKTSSDKNSGKASLDQVYIDRFLRMINNGVS